MLFTKGVVSDKDCGSRSLDAVRLVALPDSKAEGCHFLGHASRIQVYLLRIRLKAVWRRRRRSRRTLAAC